MNKKSIYISILNQGWIRPELTSLITALKDTDKYDLYITYPAKKPITNNRNTIVQKFLDTDCDFLLMIDGDNVPPENVIEMADYNRPVMGAVCFGYMDDNLIPFVMKKNKEGRYDLAESYIEGGIIEVDAVGSGVMMIRRDVLEKIPMPFENTYGPFGKKIKGLDFHFCDKAQENGYKVFCHTDMLCSHWSTVDLKNIWKTFNSLFVKAKKLKEKLNENSDNRQGGSGDSPNPSSK